MSKLSDAIEEGGNIGRHITAWEAELLLSLEARIEALEPKAKPDKKDPGDELNRSTTFTPLPEIKPE